MIYIATLLAALTMQVYFSYQVQVGLLLIDKAFVEVLSKYLDYAKVFLFDLVIELPNNIGMNKHAIKLIEGK